MGVEVGLGNRAEERSNACFIVNVDASRAAADSVDAGQMSSGTLETVLDTVAMVAPVSLNDGRPGHLLGVNDFAIDHGGALAVAATKIKTDAAALPATPHVKLGRAGRGQIRFVTSLHREGTAKDRFAHHFGIEGAGAANTISLSNPGRRLRATCDPDLTAALLPQEVLQRPLEVVAGGGGSRLAPRENL